MFMDISRLSAEFADPETETEYRRRNAAVHIRQTRFGLALWAILLALFIYADYASLGPSESFYLLFAMRLTSCTAIVVFGIFIGRHPALVTSGYGISALLVFGWTGFYMVFFLMPQDQLPWIIATVMAMLIGQFVFIPNRVATGAIAGLYAIVGSMISVRLVAGTDPANLISLGLMLLVPAANGLFVLHRFQFDRRHWFAMLLRAEEANDELKRQIEERKKLEAELKYLAETDPLTGLNNRRRYEALFEQERKRTRRYGNHLSLFVLDLDLFKNINDTHGHATGDTVLQQTAALCRRHLRESDIIGRLGGEEFVALLPDTHLSGAVRVAERIREKIAEMAFVSEEDGVRFHVTATIGVAELGPEDRNADDMIRRADGALYRGKNAGRNRVVVDTAA